VRRSPTLAIGGLDGSSPRCRRLDDAGPPRPVPTPMPCCPTDDAEIDCAIVKTAQHRSLGAAPLAVVTTHARLAIETLLRDVQATL
jgi:hypothetical protein